MDWLEQELTGALKRKDPSADFARRVVRRAERPVRPWPRWLAAAAAIVLAAGVGIGYRQYRGQMAKEQVMQALQIASVKVNRIQEQVREVGK